jgi:hypothetical protein
MNHRKRAPPHKKMKKRYILALVSIVAISAGCAEKQSTSAPVSRPAPNVSPTGGNTIAPTTRGSGETNSAPSESGLEKSKPAPGMGNVGGKVLYNLQPVKDIEVKLCIESNLYGDCIGKRNLTRTDANGEYLFANVPPRDYVIFVRVFDTKQYIFTGKYGFSPIRYKIEADKSFSVPTTNLFKSDLKVQNPKPRTSVDAESFEIKWDAYPDAAYYKLELMNFATRSNILSETVKTTSYKFEKPSLNIQNRGTLLINGGYRLRIEAYNAVNIKLAQCEDGIEFTVTNGIDPSANPDKN